MTFHLEKQERNKSKEEEGEGVRKSNRGMFNAYEYKRESWRSDCDLVRCDAHAYASNCVHAVDEHMHTGTYACIGPVRGPNPLLRVTYDFICAILQNIKRHIDEKWQIVTAMLS